MESIRICSMCCHYSYSILQCQEESEPRKENVDREMKGTKRVLHCLTKSPQCSIVYPLNGAFDTAASAAFGM